MKITLGDFKDTGENDIDIDLVSSKWNHLWMLTEWKIDNSWRIVKFKRKDSQLTNIKTTISHYSASILIDKIGLTSSNSGFGSGFTWRREEDLEYLDNWRRRKYNKTTKKL